MRRVNDRNFLNLWQILYRASSPHPGQTRWRVGDVDWCKERHSFSGPDYAVTMEVHCLRSPRSTSRPWSLMVVTEHWWDDRGEPLKSASWARVTSGNPREIAAWLRTQDHVRAAVGEVGAQ